MINKILNLADNNLILSQRNGEWCGHGPILEQDIAITNITLDLLGQARLWYQYASTLLNNVDNNSYSEDALAYRRNEREFLNILMVELPKGNWGFTILRQYFFSQFQFLLYSRLKNSGDTTIAAIAEKSLKEISYHIKWSSEWVLRLGDGTDESHEKMQDALDDLWPYTGEMFIAANFENEEEYNDLKIEWLQKVSPLLEEATLKIPENTFMQTGGKSGIHTEHLGYLLAEMQYLQRAYPDAEW